MMVCPYDENRLLLILQVDHSRDTGWWDWEIKPQVNDEGLPPDYIGSIKHLGGKVWLDFYRHGIHRLAEQDPYAGYIVSLHSDGLLTQGRGLLPYMPDY